MARSKSFYANADTGSSFFAKPWFVAIVVFGCFGILTPKIFLPLFRQLLGFNRGSEELGSTSPDRTSPYLRARTSMRPPEQPAPVPPSPEEYSRPGPQFGRQAPAYTPQGGSSGKSLLNYLLPVYAIGIGLYMIYTLFKVFNKDKDKKEGAEGNEEEDEFEPKATTTGRFRERNPETSFRWDPNESEFKYADKYSSHFAKSEESEDEISNYERYRNLDPDYVAYLKERRRLKRLEEKGLASPKVRFPDMNPAEDDIELTPNIGLTSITNTNVLMNDTLERMKFSLNKINNQLIQVERKGVPLDDPEIEGLRMQLSQTEMQMAKIMNIINTVSGTIQGEKAKMKKGGAVDPADYGSTRLEDLDEDDEGQPIYPEDSDSDEEEQALFNHYQQQQQQMYQAMARKQQQQVSSAPASSRKKNARKPQHRGAKHSARTRASKDDYIEEQISIERTITIESDNLRQRRGNRPSQNEEAAESAERPRQEKAKDSDEERPRPLSKKGKNKKSVSSLSSLSLPSEDSGSSLSSESRSSSPDRKESRRNVRRAPARKPHRDES